MAKLAVTLSACAALVAVSGAISGAGAQERRDIFADPENLKVLPEDTSSAELRATMRGFARNLGLRCSSCHVGEEDQPIFDYDFAADDKALKLIARDMMRMVADINETVGDLDRGEEHQFVKVNCVTCHRGQNRPRMIEDVLAETYAEGGVDAAIEKYMELRDRHYGGFMFDFSADRLAQIAQAFGAAAPEDAFKVHDLNVELNPSAGAAYSGRGQAYQRAGELQNALADYRKAMEVDPNYAFLGQAVAGIEAQLAQE